MRYLNKIRFFNWFQLAFQRVVRSQIPMTGGRSKCRFSRVKVRSCIQAICLKTQAVGIKSPHVLVRKFKKFEELQTNTIIVNKNVRGRG